MFILTNFNIASDVAQVLDTSDNTNEVIRLSILAHQITTEQLKVKGIGKLDAMKHKNSLPVSRLGIYICSDEAKTALVNLHMKRYGITREQAKQRLGLV